ncbi:hypothetical protein [Methanolobus bombayensis]|nr:hypothetical protein [Methanolobus bombayensis]MBP1908579.1 hypothetical protein [Methanolobus bombayensis]
MKISSHPLIRQLAEIDPEMLPLFSPTERAVIETCKDIVEKQNEEN